VLSSIRHGRHASVRDLEVAVLYRFQIELR